MAFRSARNTRGSWRVFPSDWPRTCFLRGITICRKHEAVRAASHTTDSWYSTSISASSAAADVSRRMFLMSFQASRSASATWRKKAFHIPSAALHDRAPSALQRKRQPHALCAPPYRLPPPASLCFDGSSDTTEEHGPLGPCSTACRQDPDSSRPCFIYIWSQP